MLLRIILLTGTVMAETDTFSSIKHWYLKKEITNELHLSRPEKLTLLDSEGDCMAQCSGEAGLCHFPTWLTGLEVSDNGLSNENQTFGKLYPPLGGWKAFNLTSRDSHMTFDTL